MECICNDCKREFNSTDLKSFLSGMRHRGPFRHMEVLYCCPYCLSENWKLNQTKETINGKVTY